MKYLAVILILIIPSGIYFISSKKKSSHNVIIIYPDPAPIKKRPVDAGGVYIPKLDKVFYENLNAKKQTIKKINLLPEPEQPLNIIAKTKDIESDDQIDNIINDILLVERPNEESQTFKIDQEIENFNLNNYSNIKITNIINNSGRLVSLDRTKSQKYFKIQLALTKSEAEAIKEMEKIKAKQLSVLMQHQIYVKQSNFKNGLIVYQVLLGEFDKISRAKQICKKLIMQNQNCFITK